MPKNIHTNAEALPNVVTGTYGTCKNVAIGTRKQHRTRIHAVTEHEPNDTITMTPLNEASGISCKAGKTSMHLRISAIAASILQL